MIRIITTITTLTLTLTLIVIIIVSKDTFHIDIEAAMDATLPGVAAGKLTADDSL